VAAVWVLRASWSFFGGIIDFDSLWYQLPFAARFVHTTSLTLLHDVAYPSHTFFHANGEVFHALGMFAVRSDLLSTLWTCSGSAYR
jgi:hypothetical protein